MANTFRCCDCACQEEGDGENILAIGVEEWGRGILIAISRDVNVKVISKCRVGVCLLP